jgi:transcriptional regulator with XRE-family HTH domain
VRAVGRRIAEIRRLRGLTQEGLADKVGMGTKNLQRVEAGQNLTLRTIGLLAEKLGISPHELLLPVGSSVSGSAADVLSGLRRVGVDLVVGRERPSLRFVPVLPLEVAAGYLRDPAAVEALAWCELPGRRARPRRGTFVAQVVGDSMQPRIPRDAWCVFGPIADDRLVGRILLVEHRGLVDPDTGSSFGVKRIAAVDTLRPGRRRVTPLNGRYKPSVIEVSQDEELRPIAEFLAVLRTTDARRSATA